MSVLRKLLGSLLAVVAVAALVGVALPASPASAVPQCRWEIDPQPDCPTMPVVPPPMRPREPAPTMVPQPGGPVAQPGERCRNAESRSTIVVRESGLPEKPVYQLIVNVDFCAAAAGRSGWWVGSGAWRAGSMGRRGAATEGRRGVRAARPGGWPSTLR
jgi:hypothetical protein